MPLRNTIAIAFCCATALLTSCEKSINVDTPPYVRNLTVLSVNDAGQPVYVVVGSSTAIKDRKSNPDLFVKNAEVKLFIDDVYAETMPYDTVFGYQSNIFTVPGKKYTVKVSAPTFTPVEASSVAQAQVNITSLEYSRNVRKNEDGDEQDAVTIKFTDPVQPGDLYIVKLNGPQGPGTFSFNFCVNSPDASIETPSGGVTDVSSCLDNNAIFIRDAFFNGREKEIKFYANSAVMAPSFDGVDSVYATIELLHVTDAYFRYEQSSRVARNNNGNPFAEPVNVSTNVANGFGIFAVTGAARREIK